MSVFMFMLLMAAAACTSGQQSTGSADSGDVEPSVISTTSSSISPSTVDTTAGSESQAPEGDDDAGFPVEVETAVGPVVIESRPLRIVSLSPSATEILFAIGAGDRVVAVDRLSDHPSQAPQGTLDGFAPDVAELIALTPDLVVASGVPTTVSDRLADDGVAMLIQPGAASLDDTFDQILQLGSATGTEQAAESVVADLRSRVEAAVASAPAGGQTVRVFHEIDDSFYTATSASFVGQVYATLGFDNIADPFDDGTGFPLLDGDSIVAADPTLIVFTSRAGQTREEIAARPGWETVTAVRTGNIIEVDPDSASRWGPRIVDFMEAVVAALNGAG
jgi:iron complex transport system substrate-binding protein